MSQRFRRNITRSFFLSLWAFATLVLLGMVVLLVREIAKSGRDPLEAFVVAEGEEKPPPTQFASDRSVPTGMREVQLYFGTADGRSLAPETRQIPVAPSTVENCRAALVALIAGSQSGLAAVLPPSVTVKALYLLPQGELVINFSRELQSEHARISSASMESLFVQGVVHTVTQASLQNAQDPKVRKVRILVEDAPPTEAYPAHIDLSEPVAPDSQWLPAQG
jgi:spore germination protein GerM